MALTEITNGKLTAVISDKGAELQSLVYGGIEYIWQGDPKYWNRRAPVLFPLWGAAKNDALYLCGRDLPYRPARVCARQRVRGCGRRRQQRFLQSQIESGAEKKKYPFDFEFVITYRLQGTTLAVESTK